MNRSQKYGLEAKNEKEVERLFRRRKGFRRIFLCFDKLDGGGIFFLPFALILEARKSVNTP